VAVRRAFARARDAYVAMHAYLGALKAAVLEHEGVCEQM
jgi:hypothetical protein